MSKASRAAKRRPSHPGGTASILDSARLMRQAGTMLSNGQVDTACQILSQLRDASSSAEGRSLLVAAFSAQAFDRWERPSRALASLERAAALAPSDAELRRLHGTLLRRAGRLRAAVVDLDQAHRLAPDDASVASEMVLAHLAAGDRFPRPAILASATVPQAAALAVALQAAAEGELPVAERTLAKSPHPFAKLLRAITLLAKGEGHAALPTLRQNSLDESLPNNVRAYASYYLGIAHIRRRELTPAAKALEGALRLGLSGELVRDHLTWTYNQLAIDAVLDQDLPRAADWLTKLSEVGGPTADAARENVAYALRLYGQERARAGDYDDAARAWTRALEILPRDFVLRQNLAVALERADRADEAIPHWHELVQQLAKGGAKTGKHRLVGAAATEDEALSAHVRAVAHRHLADLYLEEDDVERAIAQMERALAVVPDDTDTRRELAGLLVEEGSARKAIPHLERLLADQPDSVSTLLELASAQRLLKNFDAAVAALERAFALSPEDPTVRVGLGTLAALRALDAPSSPRAEDDARRAVTLLPRGRMLGLVSLGAVLLAQGKRREAIQTLKRAIREATHKANATIEVGHAYWQAGERELASAAWADAMRRAKRSPEYFMRLAVEWGKAGVLDRCVECFGAMLERARIDDAIVAAELLAATPSGKLFLVRVLKELVPRESAPTSRMFLTNGLLLAGDIPAARELVNSIALESVAANARFGINFVTSLDYRYHYRLLDRKTALAVARWLDDHPSPLRSALSGGSDGG